MKAGRQMEQFRANTKKALLDVFVERNIGSPETVDRLLRIPHQEELARNRAGNAPVCLSRIVGGEQEEDLGLKRIGVLKLVDKKMREAVLQLRSHASIIANKVACFDKQIEKIQTAGLRL
jgi:hypothetical protein